jgi:hypothetical protein
VHRRRPQPVLIDQSPLLATVKDLQPLEILQVRRTCFESLYAGLIERSTTYATAIRWGSI